MAMKRKTSASSRRVPRRALALLAAGAGGLLLLAAAVAWLSDAAVRPLAIGGPFSLTDDHGRAVTDRDFKGRYLLVTFGYTHCRDVCPTTLTAITGAMDTMGAAADRVQPLFITLDPSRDTPAVLQRYMASFTPRLIGLTGSADALEKVAASYKITRILRPSDGQIDHSSVIYLMAPDGRYVAPLPADDSGPKLAARLAHYMS